MKPSNASTALILAACLSAMLTTTSARAALLDVDISFPRVAFNSASSIAFNYDAGSELLTVTAVPTLALFSTSELPAPLSGMVGLSIQARVDAGGQLLGGVAGDDFTLTGTVSRTVNSVTTVYTGTLLTGEITGLGFLESGATDQFDFRFVGTGGSLIGLFSAALLAADITSASSSFGGGFAADFSGQANGIVGQDRARPVPDAAGTLPLLVIAVVGLMTVVRRSGGTGVTVP
jgi:hypothetical protein